MSVVVQVCFCCGLLFCFLFLLCFVVCCCFPDGRCRLRAFDDNYDSFCVDTNRNDVGKGNTAVTKTIVTQEMITMLVVTKIVLTCRAVMVGIVVMVVTVVSKGGSSTKCGNSSHSRSTEHSSDRGNRGTSISFNNDSDSQ